MNWDLLKALVVETVTNPAQAAKKVLALDIPTQAIWVGLALIAVLNGLYYAMLLPSLAAAGLITSELAAMPLIVTMFILFVFVGMVYLTTIGGRFLGGTGDVLRVGQVTVWLQGLRLAAQVAIAVISFVAPFLGWIASTALGLWGIWIALNFVAAAHEFSIPKAIGALVITFFGLVLALSILTALFGFAPPVSNGEI